MKKKTKDGYLILSDKTGEVINKIIISPNSPDIKEFINAVGKEQKVLKMVNERMKKAKDSKNLFFNEDFMVWELIKFSNRKKGIKTVKRENEKAKYYKNLLEAKEEVFYDLKDFITCTHRTALFSRKELDGLLNEFGFYFEEFNETKNVYLYKDQENIIIHFSSEKNIFFFTKENVPPHKIKVYEDITRIDLESVIEQFNKQY